MGWPWLSLRTQLLHQIVAQQQDLIDRWVELEHRLGHLERRSVENASSFADVMEILTENAGPAVVVQKLREALEIAKERETALLERWKEHAADARAAGVLEGQRITASE